MSTSAPVMFAVCVCVCVCVCARARLVTSWWLIGCRICILGLACSPISLYNLCFKPTKLTPNQTKFCPPAQANIYPHNQYNKQIQIKLRWALFVTYTTIQCIMSSEMCSLHLTHPSGAVGSRLCSVRGAVGGSVPCSRVSPQSWTLPAGPGIRTHNLGLPRVSSPTLYPLGQTLISNSAQNSRLPLTTIKFKTVYKGVCCFCLVAPGHISISH